ncbi:MAG: LacI family DNA-binding transcriptional regulator [Candidatus Omnitrophota bacterium]
MAKTTKRKGANLNEIASRCNLSVMTVSRALRNDPYVASGTRQQVLETARKLNYIPLGRRYLANKTAAKHYSILFQEDSSMKDGFFGDVIRSIQHELSDSGAICSFDIIKENFEDFLKLDNTLISSGLDGLLVVGAVPPAYLNTLLQQFPALVLVDNPGGPEISRPYNAVACDNQFGSSLAIRHLLGLGRKRILLICGNPKHYFSRELINGYRNTLLENGVEFDEKLILFDNFHIEGGYEVAKRALESGLEFDAVFSNDEMAFGAMKALKEKGVKVPDDASVVGFDNLAIAKNANPPLTTIAVDREKIGAVAAKRLLSIVNNTEERFEKIVLFPELIIRESCGFKKKGGDVKIVNNEL